jgi:hypothetical protein
MRNSGGYDRTLNSVEIEWDIPFNRRVHFGGSYTYTRLISNYPGTTENPRNDGGTGPSVNLDTWWDYVVGDRSIWAPARAITPENYFKWYLLFDLSANKLQQTLAFNGLYTSAAFRQDGYNYALGAPYEWYPDFLVGTGGGTRAGSATVNGLYSTTVYVPSLGTNFTAGNDAWEINLRYMLTVPLVRNFAWFTEITMSNPFNHRHKTGSGWFQPAPTGQAIIPVALVSDNVTAANFPYGTEGNIWKSGGINGQYINPVGGRSFGVSTGLRF